MTGKSKWGFLRETKESAKKAGIDPLTGLHRTGLEEYLAVIFPETSDWVHDKSLGKMDGKSCKKRPDYRSESQKLIVEFDGLHHYQKPDIIRRDSDAITLYGNFGYAVVRIPYFIQLTNEAVETLFGVVVKETLFDASIPSLDAESDNSPAYLCAAGVSRMAKEFRRFPEQYKTNIEFLRKQNDPFLSGVELLETEYNRTT